jgi:hypothetical protein
MKSGKIYNLSLIFQSLKITAILCRYKNIAGKLIAIRQLVFTFDVTINDRKKT